MASVHFPVNLVIKNNKLEWLDKIGQGGCGEVWRVKHKDWGLLAVKKIAAVTNINEQRVVLNMQSEAAILAELRNPNIVQFSGVIWDPPHIGLAMPIAKYGSMSQFIAKYKVSWPMKLNFSHQISEGMTYLVTLPKPVLHGDLKMTNVLVDDGLMIRIADFGISQWRQFQTSVTGHKLDMHAPDLEGTVTHLAPECFDSPNLSQHRDVYAFGILLWELLTEKSPFQGFSPMQIALSIQKGTRPELNDIPTEAPTLFKDIIVQSWHKSPQNRPRFQVLKEKLEGLCSKYTSVIDEGKLNLFRLIHGEATTDNSRKTSMITRDIVLEMLPTSVSVRALGRVNLPKEGHCLVGMGNHGDILIAYAQSARMHNYEVSTYKQKWQKSLPMELNVRCKKQIGERSVYLQDYGENKPTYCLSMTLEMKETVHHPGELIGCLFGDAPVYVQRVRQGIRYEWVVNVMLPGQKLTLQPPRGQKWDKLLSVCATSNKIIVVGYAVKPQMLMDVFTKEGDHVLHKQLSYMPQGYNACTTFQSNCLLVAEFESSPKIHVHSMTGEVITVISCSQLGLSTDDRIHAIKLTGRDTLHVVVGGTTVKSLHAYQVLAQ